jgi:hypothetical protein
MDGKGQAMYKFVAVFLLLSSSAFAEVNVFLDFADWEKQPEAVRGAYIAGAFDSLVLFTVDEQTRQAGQFFQGCVSAAKMTAPCFRRMFAPTPSRGWNCRPARFRLYCYDI